MLRSFRIGLTAAACALSASAWSADYVFDIVYAGGGNASLAPGSTDPRSLTLVDGDHFVWTIDALPGHQWTVLSGGTVFPLMAFGVNESGDRTSDFHLELLNDGGVVLTADETGSVQSFVHMGTNTIALGTGLVFDQLRLQYSLLSAIEVTSVPDPDNPGQFIDVRGGPVGSTPSTLLPIFSMLDNTNVANTTTTIYGPVPEPASWALWLAGACALGMGARRRREAR